MTVNDAASNHEHIPNRFGPMRPGSLSSVVNHYKGAVTKGARRSGHDAFAWQPRFHDHIIRNERSFQRIRHYIATNPRRWHRDRNQR